MSNHFFMQFPCEGHQITAALKEAEVGFIPISIADLPTLTSSSKQAEVLEVVKQRAIAYFQGKVHFLPDLFTSYKKLETELANPELSNQERQRLQHFFNQIRPEMQKLSALLFLQAGTSKIKNNLFFHWLADSLERENLLPAQASAYQELGLRYDDLLSYRSAIVCYQLSLNLASQLNLIRLKGSVYYNLGTVYGSLGEYRQAIQFFTACLGIARQVEDPALEGSTYCNLGVAYNFLGEYKQAITHQEQHLNIAEERKDLRGEGLAYGYLGCTYKSLGDYKKAIKFQEKSLKIAEQLNDSKGEAWAYCNLGANYYWLGDYRAAIDFYEKSLKIAEQIGDLSTQATTYDNLGLVYYCLGEYRKAIDFHEKSLKIAKQIEDLACEGRIYGNLGKVHYCLGDYAKAIELHERKLDIAKRVEDIAAEGIGYGNLGDVYYHRGEYSRAIALYQRSLELAMKSESLQIKGEAYAKLGRASFSLGEYEKAIELHQNSLKIAQQIENLPDMCIAYGDLGNVYLALGESDRAIESHQASLKLAQQIGSLPAEGKACGDLGKVYLVLGKDDRAIELYEESLRIAQQIGNLPAEGEAFANLGDIYFKLQKFRAAIDFYYKYLNIVHETKDLNSEGSVYCRIGDAHRRQGDYPLAITAYEKSISRYARLQKTNTESNIQTDIAFFQRLVLPYYHLEDLLITNPADSSKKKSFNQALRLADSSRSRALVEVLDKKADGAGEPLSVKQMQEIAAQHQTTFLLYSCLLDQETKAWVWVIPPSGEITHCLLDLTPMKNEKQAKKNRPWHLQNVRGNRGLGFLDAGTSVTRGKENTSPEIIAEKNQVIKLWYDCLIKPVKNKLPQEKGARLTIVPDPTMGDLPFSIFTGETGESLLESYTLSTVPSIRTLALLDELDQKKAKTRNLDQACIVANPEGSMLGGAEKEGKAVAQYFSKATLLRGGSATLKNVQEALPEASFIHFACHGLSEDRDGKPIKKNKHSVFQGCFELAESSLYAEDLLSTPLNAKLAVLSACYSGRGSLLKEGVVGLIHALLAAGVSTVVGTRWEIDDEPSRLIIEKFYHFYFNETPESQKAQAEGRPFGAAEALREALLFAKQEAAKGHLTPRDPYDLDFTAAWGAFFLVGLPDK